jgi:uncharacterized membrane-anchored protein
MKSLVSRVAFALAACFIAFQSAAQSAQTDPAAELKTAFEAARLTKKDGPADVRLNEQIAFHVPAGAVFVPPAEGMRILRAMGNSPSPDTLGLVFPASGDANWFAVARFVKSGYIKDDDAKDWNADELLGNLKNGTEQGNAERRRRGIPEIEVVGWVERPLYDAATHRLVWSASSRDKEAAAGSEQGVNYNTYLLGREGYLSMNFVTDLRAIESQKPIARQLLGGVEFDSGKKYADFNASTDHMAEYGLAALVGGVAAKKLGLFALIAAFVVKFAKIIGITVIAAGAGVMKFLKGRNTPPAG